MKRLLCLISSMNAGGAETFLMKVYRVLDKTKYQIDFCVNIQEIGFYDDEIIALGGRIFHIPPKTKDFKGYKQGLENLVKKENYQYIFRVASNAISFLDLKIAKKAGAKRCSVRSSNSSDGKGLKVWLAHKIGTILYDRYLDVKIAPSDLAAKYTFGDNAFNNGDVAILHNGIDLNVFHYNEQSCMNIRKELNISEKATVFGHIGRFSHQKNHMFLLEVFKEISLKDEHAIFMLVGGGELELKIKEKAEELGILNKIIFTGIRSDIPALLSAMDVFVFPSFYEGMPNTVIEAQATGLPCVIADTITKEADITGLVDYVSLQETASTWAKIALQKLNIPRKNTKEDFIKNKYDVESVAKEFVSLVFGEE